MMTEKFPELDGRYFLRIQIDDFADKVCTPDPNIL